MSRLRDVNRNTELQRSEDITVDRTVLVEFEQPFDQDNPRQWSNFLKCSVTIILSLTGFNRIMVSTIMAPALHTISTELQMSSIESNMALSVYVLATAFGPLVFGPLSEIYGRKWILHGTNVWFLIFNIVCGFSKNKIILIISRFLSGLGASAIYSLAAGVLSDIWTSEQRGKTIGLYMVIPLLGAAVGPILGGYITDHTSWRWIFWSTSILQGFLVLLSFCMFRETSAYAILQKRAKNLQKYQGNNGMIIFPNISETNNQMKRSLVHSIGLPLKLLLLHPIIQSQACFAALSYGGTYLVMSTYASLYQNRYGESTSQSSLHYISLCLGELLGATLGGYSMDKIYKRLKERRNNTTATSTSRQDLPELHIPIMLPGSLFVCIGLLIYGWLAEIRYHWALVDFGAILFTFGTQISGQALQAYTIDCFPAYAGSATASVQLFRSLGAFTFPLFGDSLYNKLDYGLGNTVIAIVWSFIGFSLPSIFWLYGRKMRMKMM